MSKTLRPSIHRLPILLYHVNDNPMVFVLLQPAHDNYCDKALDLTHADRDSATVDGVSASLVPAHPELGREGVLVPSKLAVKPPGAASPAKDAAALPLDPDLVIRVHASACSHLEDGHTVRKADGNEGGPRVGDKAGPEEVAELPRVGGGE